LVQKSRSLNVIKARAIFYYYARKDNPYSLHTIGQIVNRDHATVLHGLKTFEQFRNKEDFKVLINKIGLVL